MLPNMAAPVNAASARTGEGGSLAARAYRQIKEEILTSGLRAGELVAAHALAARYGMSRSPVSQALTLLAQEGLLKVVPRVGYVISPMTITDVHEIFQLRLHLEGLAAELAARSATPADLEAFAAADERVRAMAATLVAGDASVVRLSIETHASFHLMVAGLSGNARLVECVRRLLDESQRIQSLDPRLPNHVGFLVGAHRDVVDGLRDGDPRAAREAMERHIRQGQERVLRALMVAEDDR